jgi:osmotically-inducible protein OsmY
VLIGVRNITNDIEVFSDAEGADVLDRVQCALDRYAVIADDSDVMVSASDGAITLNGHVRTWAEHDAVMDAAWMGIGVSNVQDDLVVTG